MSDDAMLDYVRASAVLLELPLDEARARRVAGFLARTADMARQLEAAPLAVEDEPAEVYRPAPFPAVSAAATPLAAK
jgi:hypothetical protein